MLGFVSYGAWGWPGCQVLQIGGMNPTVDEDGAVNVWMMKWCIDGRLVGPTVRILCVDIKVKGYDKPPPGPAGHQCYQQMLCARHNSEPP